MRIVKLILNYLLGVAGILLISSLTVFFRDGVNFNIINYFQQVGSLFKIFLHPSQWHFQQLIGYKIVEQPFFVFVADNYVYSMTVLFTSLAIAIFVGFLLTVIVFLLTSKIKDMVVRVLNVLEAVPDVFIIFLLQVFVIWFYKKTEFLLFNFITFGDEKAYLSPIVSLTILPTIFFFKIILLLLEEEWSKDYVELARSKGFTKFYILTRHCLRNIRRSLFIQSKPIIWVTLSSLLVVEYLHNYYGVVRLVFFDPRPFTIAMALIMIFTPFFIIFEVIEWVFKWDKADIKEDQIKLYRGMQTFSHQLFKFNVIHLSKKLYYFLKNLMRSFLLLCRKPKFLLGFLYIFVMTIVSILYNNLAENPVKRLGVYRDDQDVVHGPPHPPGELLLGSDSFGMSVFDMLIVGAQYTIIFSIFIAFMRIFLGYMLTIPYIFWLGERSKRVINKLAEGMQFIPLSLIAYVLLINVTIFSKNDRVLAESFITQNLVLEVAILIIFVIPVILSNLGNESNAILKTDHVQASILLGASKSRIFFKHITGQLFPRMVHLFSQQIIQVLIVFAHLGVFGIFLGGGLSAGDAKPGQSLIYEWTAMFSNFRTAVITGRYWVVIPVIILYLLLIFSVQAISKSIIEEQQRKIGVFTGKVRKVKSSRLNPPIEKPEIEKDDFKFKKEF